MVGSRELLINDKVPVSLAASRIVQLLHNLVVVVLMRVIRQHVDCAVVVLKILLTLNHRHRAVFRAWVVMYIRLIGLQRTLKTATYTIVECDVVAVLLVDQMLLEELGVN